MTHEQYWKTVVKVVTTDTPFAARLWKNSEVRGSGVSFKWTVAYKLEDGQWYSGYEILDTTPIDEFKEAELDWVNFNVPVSISGDEEDKNQGKEAFHDLMEEKMKLLTARVKHFIGNATLQGRGVSGDTKEPYGIYTAIAEDPAARAYGGLTAGTDDAGSGDFTDWWQNAYKNGSNAAATLANIRYVNSQCQSRGARPTINVTTHELMDKIWSLIEGKQRYTTPDPELAKMGFTSFTIDGIPIVADKHCYRDSANSASNLYAIHEPDLTFRFIKGKRMHRTPWLVPTNQDAKVMHCRNKFVFAVKNPRIHAVYHSAGE